GNVSCHCLLRGFRQLVLEPSQSHQVGVQERTGLLFHLPWVGPCRHGEQRFLCGTNRSGGAGADRPLLPDTQRRLSIHENISEWGVWGRGIIFSVLASCSKSCRSQGPIVTRLDCAKMYQLRVHECPYGDPLANSFMSDGSHLTGGIAY